jgi:predicted nicotinamide N-methyase
MNYPLQLIELEDGLSLYIPEPEKVKQHYEGLIAIDPSTPFPFWAKLWASSIAMVTYLKSNPEYTNGKKVIEMGAGIGLPSFAIAKNAAQVIVSDHDEDAVELLKKNIALLGLRNIQAKRINWNELTEVLPANTLLLSDINYAPEQFASLQGLIKKYIAQGTQIIITTPQRIMGASFISSISPLIQNNQILQVMDPSSGIHVEISLIIL